MILLQKIFLNNKCTPGIPEKSWTKYFMHTWFTHPFLFFVFAKFFTSEMHVSYIQKLPNPHIFGWIHSGSDVILSCIAHYYYMHVKCYFIRNAIDRSQILMLYQCCCTIIKLVPSSSTNGAHTDNWQRPKVYSTLNIQTF